MAGIFSKIFSKKDSDTPQKTHASQNANILDSREVLEAFADFIARLSYNQISINREGSFLRTPNGMVGTPPKDYADIGEKCGLTVKAHALFLACDAGDEGFMTVFDEYNDPKYVIYYNRKSNTYGKQDLDFEKECSEEEKKTAEALTKNLESFLPTAMAKIMEAFPEIKEWQQ